MNMNMFVSVFAFSYLFCQIVQTPLYVKSKGNIMSSFLQSVCLFVEVCAFGGDLSSSNSSAVLLVFLP